MSPTRGLPALLVALTLAATPATAQRPRCGYGEALAALRAAETLLAQPVASLSTGRDQAAAAHDHLRDATGVLQGCACHRAAEDAGEASALAEQASAEHSAARIATTLHRAAFSLRLARERLSREGCS